MPIKECDYIFPSTSEALISLFMGIDRGSTVYAGRLCPACLFLLYPTEYTRLISPFEMLSVDRESS